LVATAGAVEIGGLADELELLEPRDGRSGAVGLAVEAVGSRATQPPGHARREARARARRALAGVGEDERARPVGALGLARREAGLGEQRRLLVDHEAR